MLSNSSTHQPQLLSCCTIKLMASWAMCVFRDANGTCIEMWIIWLNRVLSKEWTEVVEDLNTLGLHFLQWFFEHLNSCLILLVQLLQFFEAFMLCESSPRERQFTSTASNFYPLTLKFPVRHYICFVFKWWSSLWAKFAYRSQFARLAVICVMILTIRVLEYFGTFCAFELCIVEYGHYDSIHVLKAFSLIAVWTLILV